jgi:DNA-binding FadR family transcriptional regulator
MPAGRRRYLGVMEAVLSAIRRGELAPGDQLPSDRELSERLRVSRPTAREGLLALEFAGVIEIRPGAGAFVKSSSPVLGGAPMLPPDGERSPRELIEARIALEPAVARVCAEHTSPEQLEELLQLVGQAQAQAGPDGSLESFVRLGLDFHKELANRSGNPFLAGFCCSLVSVTDHPLWTLLNQQAVQTAQARQGQVDEHRAVVEAIASRDPDAAAEAMRRHLEGLRTVIFGV